MAFLIGFTIIMELGLTVVTGYLIILSICAFFARQKTSTKFPPKTKFAILVPAHNEERLLPELLANLGKQNYPRELYKVFIVADNCTDSTPEIGRELGATVFERADPEHPGKGYALNWLLEEIVSPTQSDQITGTSTPQVAPSVPFDAFVIFDADTVAAPNFLEVMDARIQSGENAIQGYYAVRDPDRSWEVAIRYAALAVLHYLRPLGRGVLGGSAGLKGNGMCFTTNLYIKNKWSGSVTEDIEYHMALLLNGQRVAFVPDAVLEAEMPGSLKSSTTQNVRWESGRSQMAKKYIPLLLRNMKGKNAFMMFDAIMEHLIPPTAFIGMILGIVIMFSLLTGFLARQWGLFFISIVLLVGLAFYVALGLWMVRAPKKVWVSLVYTPFYVLWKAILLAGIWLGVRKQGWVRTQR